MTTPPFGRLLTAMVTPFTADGALDLDGAASLAAHLMGQGHDGLVLNGTTGEAPTTSNAEKRALIAAVRGAVGPDVPLVAGVGTYDTAHSVELAREAAAAGADGLLVVSPYYSRPPQEGIIAHVRAVLAAGGLPGLLYDIPVRTGVAFTAETLRTLAEDELVVGVKDAKGDLAEATALIAETGLAWYSGDDAITLPLLSVGAVGTIGVITHLCGPQTRRMLDAYAAGDVLTARTVNALLVAVQAAMFTTQGAITTKAALRRLGLPAGPVRLPLVDLSDAALQRLRTDLTNGGIDLP